MFTYDIAVNLTTDTESQVKRILDKFAKQVNKNTITIQFDASMDSKKFMEKIEQIQKSVPEIDIQVKYDLLEKAVQVEKEKLKELQKSADLSNMASSLEEAVIKFRQINNEVKITGKGTRELNNMAKTIAQMVATLDQTDAGMVAFASLPDDIKKSIDRIRELDKYTKVFENAEPYKVIDETDIKKQIEYIGELESKLTELENQGASPRRTTDLAQIRRQVEDISALVNQKFEIRVDNKSAIESINEVKDYLNTIPEEKTVKITGTNAVAEKMGKFVEEFKTIVQQMENAFGEEILSEKGKNGLQASIKRVENYRDSIKKAQANIAEADRSLEKGLEDTSLDALEPKITALLERAELIKKNLKGFTVNIKLSDKNTLFEDLGTIRDLLAQIPEEKIIHINVVKDGEGNLTSSISYTKEQLEAGFGQLQKIASKYGDFYFKSTKEFPKTKEQVEATKKAFAELLDQYQKYVEYGGTRPIEDLTNNEKAVKKLKDAYKELPQVVKGEAQETEVVSDLGSEVDKVSVAVDKKNKKFEEEATVVEGVVNKEINALERLRTKLVDIAQQAKDDIFAKIQVEPTLNPQEFADKVTALIDGVFAKIQIGAENLIPSSAIKEIGQGIGSIVREMLQADDIIRQNSSVNTGQIKSNIDGQSFIDNITKACESFFVEVNVKPKVSVEDFKQSINSQIASQMGSTLELPSVSGYGDLNKTINNLANNKDGRIDGLLDTLTKLREVLNKNLGKNSLGQALKEIASQADGLKALSSIMKDYEKALEVIQQAKANTPFDEDEKALLRANDQAEEYARNEKIINEERAKGNAQAEQYAKERQKEAQDYEKWWVQALAAKEKAETQAQAQSQKRLENQIASFQKSLVTMQSNGKAGLVQDGFEKLKADFDSFVASLDSMSTAQAQGELDKLTQRGKDLEEEAKKIQKEMNAIAPSMKVEALQSKIQSILTFSKKLKSDTRKDLTDIYNALAPGKTTNAELSDFSAKLSAIILKAKQGGELGITFGDRWRRGLASLARYLTTFASFYRIVGYIRQSFTTIKELDDALIDLRKTTTMTNEALEEFYYNSANVGKQVGTTAKEIISQAAAWSRLGYSTKEEATAMAELSAQFAAISPGMTLDKATDGLVSTMKAFHIDVENVEESVMDSINRIGNTMATSNEEVVEMLTRSSAAMNAANNSLAETIALESAAVQITRNAETTGTAFRTISMRIRGLDEETEEASEDFEVLQGKIADLTKTAKTPGGISLFKDKDKTTYKSTYELLKDIAAVYHDLTDKQQAGLLEALAGKRGGQVLAGILDDFSEVERAMNEIEQSAGSADAEMEIIRESISYQLNALKQTWVGFLQDLIDRGTVQKFLENLTILSEKFIELAENNPVGAAAGVYALAKALKTLVAGNIIKSISELLRTFSMFKSKTYFSSMFAPITLQLASFGKVTNKVTKDATEMGMAALEEANGVTAIGASANKAAPAVSGLAGAFSALLPLLIAVGAGYVAYKAWDELTVTVEEAEEELADVSERLENIKGQIEELESLDFRTAAQETKLNNLKEQLSLEEQIYAVKQRQVLLEKYGSKLSDFTDKDNYRAKLLEDTNGQNKGSSSYLMVMSDSNLKKIEAVNQEIKFYEEGIANIHRMIDEGEIAKELGKNQIDVLVNKIHEAQDELKDLNVTQDNYQADIAAKIINYTQAIEDMKTDLDFMESDKNGLFTQNDINELKKTITLYENQLKKLRNAHTSYAVDLGLDLSNQFNEVLNSEKYAEIKDELVQMGKEGSLSVEYLRKNFKGLIRTLGLTIDQTDILYTHLMNLADPFRNEKADFAKNVVDRLNIKTNSRGNKSGLAIAQSQKAIQEYLDTLEEEDLQALFDMGVDYSSFDGMDAQEAIDYINKILEETGSAKVDVEIKEFSNQDFSENLTTKLGNLQTSYNSFFEDIKKGNKEVMDLDSLESMRKDLVSIDGSLGVTAEQFKAFEDVVGNSNSTIDEMKEAYDTLGTQLANVYFDKATEEMENLDEATKQLIKDQLELKGYTEESVDAYVEFRAAGKDTVSFASQLRNEVGEAMRQLQEGGGVNLELRPTIDTSILKDVYWEDAGEGCATVFTRGFSNAAGDIAINFTPIIVDENGNFVDALEPEALEEYAAGVIEGTHDDYLNLQIGAKFEGKDAIAQAEKAAIKIHELQDVYYNYNEILQSVTESNQAEVEAQLEAAGVTDAHAIVVQSLAANLEVQANESKAVEAATSDMAGETENASANFVQEANMSNLAKVYLADLVAAQTIFNNQDLDVSQKITALSQLASAYFGTAAAAQLVEMTDNRGYDHSYSVSPEEAWKRLLAQYQTFEPPKIDFGDVSDTKSAGSAGKDAGKAYKEAFDEELSKLKDSYERGEITLAQYLDAYKALIEKYFSDTEKYAEERAEALHEYMETLKGYYDSAISGVITIIDYRIKAIQKQKDAALKAIEEERKAAKKALEERKKEIEKEIKLKQKQIKQLEKMKKPLQDEIDAIQKAAEERKRELEYEKDLYELEKLQNQRTQFIYKDGQMVYQTDPDAVRDAREKVKEDEEEKRIAELEKQIELIDEQIELLNETIELLQEESDSIDEQIEAIDEFYDKLVEETTAAFDAMLEQLENLKSKWEELAEIDKIAGAWKDVGGIMEMLGYTVDDVLNDTPGAFDAFKEAYIACLAGMNGQNDQYLEGLSQVTGKSIEELKKMMGEMENLGDKTKQPLEDASKNIEEVGNKAETVSGQMGTYATKVSEAASSSGELDSKTTNISGNLDNINSSISKFDGQPIQNLIDKFESLRSKLIEVKNALGEATTGSNGEQSLGGLAGTLQSLNGITFDTLISNFEGLLKSIDAVTTALGGGGGGGDEVGSLASGGGTEGEATGGGGLAGAIQGVKTAADTYIGTGGGGENGEVQGGAGEQGGNTAISDFEAFKDSVDNVSAAIGGENAPAGTGGEGEEGGNLTDTLKDFADFNHEMLMGGGENESEGGIVGDWEAFNQQLSDAEQAITNLAQGLLDIQDKGPYETTLTVHLVFDGEGQNYTGTATHNGGHGTYSFNVLEKIGLPGESVDLISKFKQGKHTGTAKFSGSANLGGNWAYEGGKTLIAEIGPELVVYPNGRFETFDRPQMVNLPRGSVIFNHLQTSEILDTKNQVRSLTGKSNLNGSLPANFTPLSQANPEAFNALVQNAELLRVNTEDMRNDLADIGYATDDIKQAVQNITNNNHAGTTITFGDLQFTCNGITSAEVLSEVGNALQREFQGLALNAYQRAVNMA